MYTNFKNLTGSECGTINELVSLGQQLSRDQAFRDEGISQNVPGREDFATHAPETFRVDELLKEMREIDARLQNPIQMAAPVKNNFWTDEFAVPQQQNPAPIPPQSQQALDESASQFWTRTLNTNNENIWARDFFEESELKVDIPMTREPNSTNWAPYRQSEFLRFMNVPQEPDLGYKTKDFFNDLLEDEELVKESIKTEEKTEIDEDSDLVKDFEESKRVDSEFSENYNKQFWDRLQDEWKKISESDLEQPHPWINQFSDYFDSYREYQFDENNPLIDIENAFEKGKLFLAAGDGPSAVLCFESAVKQDPENAEIWEYLGISQAENEKDPNAIAALKKSLELKPDNRKVLMALAVCYTNESIQNQAIKMLIKWLKCHPKYAHLVPSNLFAENTEEMASSLVRGPELKETQDLFLKAVQMNAKENNIDPEIQEALGIAFNLSSEYDKAVDCFQAAISKTPENAKLWNRLGASYANGQRSVEAVAAYKKALEIEPGFVRARYNVGIICINMASYKEAAEHFLVALNHQAESKIRSGINIDNINNQMSETIWSSLRMAISLMGRHELQKYIDGRDLDALNKEFGI